MSATDVSDRLRIRIPGPETDNSDLSTMITMPVIFIVGAVLLIGIVTAIGVRIAVKKYREGKRKFPVTVPPIFKSTGDQETNSGTPLSKDFRTDGSDSGADTDPQPSNISETSTERSSDSAIMVIIPEQHPRPLPVRSTCDLRFPNPSTQNTSGQYVYTEDESDPVEEQTNSFQSPENFVPAESNSRINGNFKDIRNGHRNHPWKKQQNDRHAEMLISDKIVDWIPGQTETDMLLTDKDCRERIHSQSVSSQRSDVSSSNPSSGSSIGDYHQTNYHQTNYQSIKDDYYDDDDDNDYDDDDDNEEEEDYNMADKHMMLGNRSGTSKHTLPDYSVIAECPDHTEVLSKGDNTAMTTTLKSSSSLYDSDASNSAFTDYMEDLPQLNEDQMDGYQQLSQLNWQQSTSPLSSGMEVETDEDSSKPFSVYMEGSERSDKDFVIGSYTQVTDDAIETSTASGVSGQFDVNVSLVNTKVLKADSSKSKEDLKTLPDSLNKSNIIRI